MIDTRIIKAVALLCFAKPLFHSLVQQGEHNKAVKPLHLVGNGHETVTL